jgi:hypothetical protein
VVAVTFRPLGVVGGVVSAFVVSTTRTGPLLPVSRLAMLNAFELAVVTARFAAPVELTRDVTSIVVHAREGTLLGVLTPLVETVGALAYDSDCSCQEPETERTE